MIYNPYYFYYPNFKSLNMNPPTLQSVMRMIAISEEKENVKIKDLPKETHQKIFDFDYPLTDKINKDDFEIKILKEFLMRRIGYETVTAFQIHLDSKLNEIMPMYNKMFEALDGWDIFNSGEVTTTNGTDNRTRVDTSNATNNITSTIKSQDTVDSRLSDMPQNRIQDVKDGSYLTQYGLNTTDTNSTNTSNGTSTSGTNSTDNNLYNSTTTRTPADKISIYKEFSENLKSIYTLLYKDLESLFYGLAD